MQRRRSACTVATGSILSCHAVPMHSRRLGCRQDREAGVKGHAQGVHVPECGHITRVAAAAQGGCQGRLREAAWQEAPAWPAPLLLASSPMQHWWWMNSAVNSNRVVYVLQGAQAGGADSCCGCGGDVHAHRRAQGTPRR